MRLHIMDLIERHSLNYSWCRRPTEAWAVHEFEEIKIAPIRSRSLTGQPFTKLATSKDATSAAGIPWCVRDGLGTGQRRTRWFGRRLWSRTAAAHWLGKASAEPAAQEERQMTVRARIAACLLLLAPCYADPY